MPGPTASVSRPRSKLFGVVLTTLMELVPDTRGTVVVKDAQGSAAVVGAASMTCRKRPFTSRSSVLGAGVSGGLATL